jgi:hypothetical protein
MYARIICIFVFNVMFFVNFRYYYVLCLRGHASCNKKIVDFNLVCILLYIVQGLIHCISTTFKQQVFLFPPIPYTNSHC